MQYFDAIFAKFSKTTFSQFKKKNLGGMPSDILSMTRVYKNVLSFYGKKWLYNSQF